jgi:hypothetical protein
MSSAPDADRVAARGAIHFNPKTPMLGLETAPDEQYADSDYSSPEGHKEAIQLLHESQKSTMYFIVSFVRLLSASKVTRGCTVTDG